jgi:hypothetical protein
MTDANLDSTLNVIRPAEIKGQVKVIDFTNVAKIRQFTGLKETELADDVIGLAISYSITYCRREFPDGYFNGLDVDTKELLVTLAAAQILLKNKTAGTLHQKITQYGLSHVTIPKTSIDEKLNSLYEMYWNLVQMVRPALSYITPGTSTIYSTGESWSSGTEESG